METSQAQKSPKKLQRTFTLTFIMHN